MFSDAKKIFLNTVTISFSLPQDFFFILSYYIFLEHKNSYLPVEKKCSKKKNV